MVLLVPGASDGSGSPDTEKGVSWLLFMLFISVQQLEKPYKPANHGTALWRKQFDEAHDEALLQKVCKMQRWFLGIFDGEA